MVIGKNVYFVLPGPEIETFTPTVGCREPEFDTVIDSPAYHKY